MTGPGKSNTSSAATLADLDASLGIGPTAGKSQDTLDPSIGGIQVDSSFRKPRVSSNTILVVCVVAVAGTVLWGMRFVGLGAGNAFANTPIDKDLERFAARPQTDHTKLLADLQASRVERQVNEDEVKKNPFRLAGPTSPAVVDEGAVAARLSAEAQRQEDERKRKERGDLIAKVDAARSNLKLNSTITGSTPAARINNRLYRIGDLISGYFTLARVTDRSIDIEFEGRIYKIEMSGGEGLEGNGLDNPLPSTMDPR